MISIKLILLLTSITPSITFHDACLEAFRAWPEYGISKEARDYLYDYAYHYEVDLVILNDIFDYYGIVLEWWHFPDELRYARRKDKDYYEDYGWILDPDGVLLYTPRQVRKYAQEQYFHAIDAALAIAIVREVLQDTIFEIPEPVPSKYYYRYQNPTRDQG